MVTVIETTLLKLTNFSINMVYYVLMDLEMFLIQLSDDKYHKQNYKESNHTIDDCSIPVNFTSHIA